MCTLLHLPRSTFYKFTTRSRSATATRRDELTEAIRDLFGTPAVLGTISKIMQAEDLVTVQPRAWKRTTIQEIGRAHV